MCLLETYCNCIPFFSFSYMMYSLYMKRWCTEERTQTAAHTTLKINVGGTLWRASRLRNLKQLMVKVHLTGLLGWNHLRLCSTRQLVIGYLGNLMNVVGNQSPFYVNQVAFLSNVIEKQRVISLVQSYIGVQQYKSSYL